jgi:plastocyanin
VRRRSWWVTLATIAVLGVACGGDDAADVGAGGDGGGGGSSVALSAANFAFSPTSLSVGAGGSIEFTNEDDTEHNFTATDADLDEDADPGGSVTIDLAGVEPGSYEFFCEYHRDSMTGTLEVTE